MKTKNQVLKDQRGMATIEALPILIVFLMMVSYMIGSFGVVHTGILHSVAARTYAFETFSHKANLVYFRDKNLNFQKMGTRLHGIGPEIYDADTDDYGRPTQRSISMVMSTGEINNKNEDVHNQLVPSEVKDGVRVRENVAVNPIWIKVQYGICLDSQCGD